MKNPSIIFLSVLFVLACSRQGEGRFRHSPVRGDRIFPDTTVHTNDFYDNEITYVLGVPSIEISGETANPGRADLNRLPLRSVIVKETILGSQGEEFVGAYRYDGYSLYDILNETVVRKNNEDEFPPVIDLYVEVWNDAGDHVVLSWGELYYPVHRHEIIIATRVMHIVPTRTRDYWPLPESAKLIVGSDLITERNLPDPSRIVVKSYSGTFKVDREISPLFSEKMEIVSDNQAVDVVSKLPDGLQFAEYPNVFYGRGRGIHGITGFKGVFLRDLLEKYFPLSKAYLRNGLFVIAGIDGYRAVFTYSEIMNRNDQSEVLLIDSDNYERAGKFSLFVGADFFSDRAIKAVSGIHFLINP